VIVRVARQGFDDAGVREVCWMYVCLCVGATNQTVSDAVERGASTSKEIAAACGAGADCGRCRRTLRAIIASALKLEHAS
jgi:bacterioferritin-associated ferredoxin